MRKTATFLLVSVFLFGIVQGTEAQFLNRLKNRIVDEAEKVVIDKTADKAAEKTGEAMDKILSQELDVNKLLGEIGTPVDINELPEVYRFDYLYRMKMATGEGDLQFDYLLNKTEPYVGMKPNMDTDVVMVIDEGNKAIVTIAEGQAFAMSMKEDNAVRSENDELAGEELLEDYTITQLPNRTFLGYDCVGYRMENDDHSMIVYVAPDMEASFDHVFDTKQANIPPRMKSWAKHYKNGLMMYMEMEDKQNKGSREDARTTMECIAFEKATREIRTR